MLRWNFEGVDMGANEINSVTFVACFMECCDLFHAKWRKCLCKAQDDSKDIFEGIGCSTNTQLHCKVTDPLVPLTHGRTAVKTRWSSSRACHRTT